MLALSVQGVVLVLVLDLAVVQVQVGEEVLALVGVLALAVVWVFLEDT